MMVSSELFIKVATCAGRRGKRELCSPPCAPQKAGSRSHAGRHGPAFLAKRHHRAIAASPPQIPSHAVPPQLLFVRCRRFPSSLLAPWKHKAASTPSPLEELCPSLRTPKG